MTQAVFYVLAVSAVITALLCILSRSTISAVLWLTATMLSLAAIYLLLNAEFVAAIQGLVYAGPGAGLRRRGHGPVPLRRHAAQPQHRDHRPPGSRLGRRRGGPGGPTRDPAGRALALHPGPARRGGGPVARPGRSGRPLRGRRP